MSKKVLTLTLVFAMTVFAATALADWDPPDGHKMHYPQMPDELGWDVNATWPVLLGDDWRCSQSGPVEDIHFWGSWRHDIQGQVVNFVVRIYSDIPANQSPTGYSMPGNLLWEEVIHNFLIRPYDPPVYEGWYDPVTGEYFFDDHNHYFQYNITDIPNPFEQQQDSIYWLVISANLADPNNTHWGWKSSIDHFNDDAVWSFQDENWIEMYEPPDFQQSLDLSFVITGGEPPADTCLDCSIDVRPDLVPCDGSVPIQFQIDVTNCGSTTVPVYGEIYPTIGDCATGSPFDFNINRLLTGSLAPGATFTGYYFYAAGNRCAMNLSLVAINLDVGTAVDSWYDRCCDEFYFTSPFERSGPPEGVWGSEGSMFYSVDETEALPTVTTLGQNYPNPFNANTIIPFTLANDGEVSLKVYNLGGQLIETLVESNMNAGYHTISWDASSIASGVYFYTLKVDGQTMTKKLHLLK
ncbi:MAG: T9SS type A sorting domain-containing protein [candidate division Zixibacteria bacterium]|nr:T9SS type A sorting domain-containing protein [candidate division Zixibacteria bacterium]